MCATESREGEREGRPVRANRKEAAGKLQGTANSRAGHRTAEMLAVRYWSLTARLLSHEIGGYALAAVIPTQPSHGGLFACRPTMDLSSFNSFFTRRLSGHGHHHFWLQPG